MPVIIFMSVRREFVRRKSMTDEPKKCDSCQDCSNPLFLLPETAGLQLQERIVYKELQRGSTIFQEGDRVDAIYMIRSGKVKLTRWDSEGNEQIVGIFTERETIWEGLLIEGSVFPYSAECMTPVSVCILYGEDLMELLKAPTVSLHLLTMLSQKLHDANERNLVLSMKNPKAKLAAFLLYREARDREESIQIRLDDISASLSLRPETVSRKLNELIDEGLVERAGKSGIRILDFEGLQDLRT